jgi:hypothetical protein
METATPDTLVLSWKPERDDYTQGFRVLQRSRRGRALLGGVAVFAGACLGVLTADETLITLGVIGVLFFLVVVAFGPALAARATWRRSIDPGNEIRARAVSGEGLAYEIPGATIHRAWWTFSDVVETERVFALRLARRRGIVLLAKRGLESAADIPALRELLIREITTSRPT